MQIDTNDWILIDIKYSNKCIVCQEKIGVGTKELWKKGEGVKHQKCVGLVSVQVKNIEPIEKLLDKTEWYDPKIYPYIKTLKFIQCQFCGRKLDTTKDKYMVLDRRSCNSCWNIY